MPARPEIYSVQHGLYPRPLSLARLISRRGSGKAGEEDLEEGYRRHAERFFRKVTASGIYRFSDGMLRWDDIFNPLVSSIRGVRVDGLRRFYDNNYFFKMPVIEDRIAYPEPVASRMLLKSLEVADKLGIQRRRVSLTLPGPYTLATNSLVMGSSYSSTESLMRDYAEKVILREAEEILKIGVANLDLQEPGLVFAGEENLVAVAGILRDLVSRAGGVRIWIFTYFGTNPSVASAIGKISSGSGNVVLFIDLAETSVEKIPKIPVDLEEIGVSVVNARSTRIESVEDSVKKILAVARASERIYVSHSSSLEMVPEKIALKKLRLIKRIADALEKRI